MKIETRISKARTDLLLNHPWYGTLSMYVKIEPTEAVPTFAVDGVHLFYNPKFAEKLTDAELTGVFAHEIMHLALLHPFRLGEKNPTLANIAMDLVINDELLKQGFTLPKGCLHDPQYGGGMAWEVVYHKLLKNAKKVQMGGGDGEPTGKVTQPPMGSGSDKDDKDGKDGSENEQGSAGRQMTEQDWKIAAEQAAKAAKAAGKLPAGLERLIGKSRESKHDWRTELKDFLEETVPSDYSWRNPNRRFIYQGVYLPGTVKEGFGRLAIAVDTSGSIGSRELNAFASELAAICSELKPEQVTVIYCDAKVGRVQDVDPDNVQLNPCGGGGTAFEPVFAEIRTWEEPPKALLYFTDLECYDTPAEPEYPVLWVMGMDVTKNPLFGKAIRIEI